MTIEIPAAEPASVLSEIDKLISTLQNIKTSVSDLKRNHNAVNIDSRKALQSCWDGVDKLTSMLAPPQDVLTLIVGSCLESKALTAAADLGIADALKDSELSIDEIAKLVDADPRKLRQILSLLANRSVFIQNGEKFTNNAISSSLRTDHPKSMRDFVLHWGHDSYRGANRLAEAIRLANASKAPWELEMGKSFYDWIHQPENAALSTRVNGAMSNYSNGLQDGIVEDFDWSILGEKATLVDIGCGVGAVDLALCKRWPNLTFELQDLPSVIDDAKKFWAKEDAELCSRVTFTPHDFFQPQSGRHRHFLIKQCLHNWSDVDCLRILRHIRQAISEDGRFFAAEFVMTATSNRVKHMVDVNMLTLVNSLQRTEEQFKKLFYDAGFRIVDVHENRSAISIVEAIPI
ncbi:uncharacterized protein SPPG_00006 [Spizellomyces punctatus DAOM BR117]|uniref:Uncharacterized protein n=1 Tax=Spizellomyces punctatus (strain DAOM BR117) TaxID=645134 RepID=A0A0L0HTP1_SPIPD|nr:uncharacterized protein SPPG_00006 [Spizellomyces punctatus DAOM BR117]KND04270.1 hypothetical protein SPPG_00006 [Spizellomyces punctatus DAOM BR117]|eukprot:XP_016612309.1 hypothetical protein SPPG_00006 [Spizellomyces punctatus DAOM BR117]